MVIVPGWIDTAVAYLEAHDDVAIVCGRRRERYPNQSIYNWLCDVEWNSGVVKPRPVGATL